MNLLLCPPAKPLNPASIKITGSKSESNRLLLLQALYPSITIQNLSGSDDTRLMQRALTTPETHIDIHHAGTAMRFLTAYFALHQGREVVLTGSQRMKERPVALLVDALRQLGATIRYEEKKGFPPLRITGQHLSQNRISLQAGVSSQYISALLLIAPKLPNGLNLRLEGELTSVPYIKMTLALLRKLGVETTWEENCIKLQPLHGEPEPRTFVVESDWSSASYFYSLVALSEAGTRLSLSAYRKDSLQGDAAVAAIYESLGVTTRYSGHILILTKEENNRPVTELHLNLADTPDLAQTIAVSCLGMGISCTLTGLHTLKIKETDRLKALKTELEKLGAAVTVTASELHLQAAGNLRKNISIATYNDHRMAMAFAPLALKIPIIINHAEVVSKSYPGFWEDLEKTGLQSKKV